ncbi:protein-glutamate O-methyltransferase CheR [Bdellovibrio sp. SKB1291214]|uniref:CheR family methyltransferase n=1 Tax=Bdellovibrio sp. SKB1291214 TaxID=1732569 RepID=UPI0020CB910E|nr:protein-glutamate O-methyltransferase CheR [Bdellovibrio sp. SKB1291214]UYL07351.1 protein-glutamate O-methyltransferase CheR [Bdellovibrio sp. SKB1291214]
MSMEPDRKLDGASLQRLIALVKKHTGITMEERKRELLSSRIRPRMKELNLSTPDMDYLDTHKHEIQKFVNVITTNETIFFRTPIIWEYFSQEFLKSWQKKNTDQTLRIWSSASSTGEESASIGMMCEEFKRACPTFKYRIYASDIDTDVLEGARKGMYKERSINDIRARMPELYTRYFKNHNTAEPQLCDAILSNMEFFVHNLHSRGAHLTFFDIVFCRNVLIYFNDQDQELVLRNMYASLKPDGVLIIGESESLARLKTSFEYTKPLIYKRAA